MKKQAVNPYLPSYEYIRGTATIRAKNSHKTVITNNITLPFLSNAVNYSFIPYTMINCILYLVAYDLNPNYNAQND